MTQDSVRPNDEAFEVEELLGDPEVAAAFEDAQSRSEIIDRLVSARLSPPRETQRAIAKRMETTQSAVSELESGETDPRLSTMQRYARAVGLKLIVEVASATDVDDAIDGIAAMSRHQHALRRYSGDYGAIRPQTVERSPKSRAHLRVETS